MTIDSLTPKFGGIKSPPENSDFAKSLGEFILNCGCLEATTFTWLMGLSPGLKIPADASKMRFAERLRKICQMVKGLRIPQALKSSTLALWTEAERISVFRNELAHNPLIWGMHDDGTLYAVIPNLKKSLSGKAARLIEQREVDVERFNCGNLTAALRDALDQIGVILGLPTS